jgi:hypothetical protein
MGQYDKSACHDGAGLAARAVMQGVCCLCAELSEAVATPLSQVSRTQHFGLGFDFVVSVQTIDD